MTIANGYLTLAEFKSRLEIPIATTTWDTELEIIVEGVSRAIEEYCNRIFYKTSAATRYYTPKSARFCVVDDLITITTLKTDDDIDGVYETTWTTDDYTLWPYNETPYQGIETTLYGNQFFSPIIPRSVQIVGDFGFSAIPTNVKQAAMLWCSRLWKRRDSPLGIEGTSQFGIIRLMAGEDPDIIKLLRPYVRMLS